ncbi:zinc finger BED domain-containing protein 4-like [Trichoplusia ni]|uniref:Zinc finger BED domain-containing protein 4-like n=1 Tax=Trichoplusia ni TaxID=7111 RepID=A0A7E5W8C3_TRINI|nr:zinc finger BED domain-containing protein 4-like [Trichoplusia ni]
MSPPIKSNVWDYFEPNKEDQDKADCKICKKSYLRKGRTTSSLKNHLKSMHSEEFSTFENFSKEKKLQQMKSDANKVTTPLQESKKQLSLEEVVLKEKKWDVNNLNSKKIYKLIGEMIALQNLPFNFVEGLGFRRLMQELAPRYNFRGRNFFTDFVCKELYSKVAQKVKGLIENFDNMSFTSDIWSDPSSNASLLSLTCHGIAENFDRSSIILKCETFDGRHTGDLVAEKFSNMLSEWNIKKQQLHCPIRDEGSNMKRAARLAALNDIDCTVHKIQLAIRSCLGSQENIKILKQKCKRISTHFNHSTIAQKQLQSIQDRLNQPHLKVFQDCVTRLNSTFYMFERFSKIKDALCLYMNDNEIDPVLPEECFIQLLGTFEEATRELSSSSALISSVIPIIQMLEKKVDDYLTRSQEFDPIRQAVTTLKNELSTKFSSLGENNLYTIATYLDPRYKHNFFTPVTEEKIKDDIIKMINIENDNFESVNTNAKRAKITDCMENETEQLGPGTSGFNKKPCLKNDLAMMLDSSSEDESQDEPENSSVEVVLKKELLAYRTKKEKKRINVSENPLNWWSVHRGEFKVLSPIVRRFLSAPTGSVPSEQLFSSAGLIYEPLRNRLEPEKAAILLFIKYNAPIFKFNY